MDLLGIVDVYDWYLMVIEVEFIEVVIVNGDLVILVEL